MRPYSKDLRLRVIAAVKAGQSARRAAGLYRISPSTAVKWVQRWRTTGRVDAKPYPGIIGSKLDPHRAWLIELIKAAPDITLKEMRYQLREEKGLVVGRGTVWRFCQREGLSFKKNAARRRARSIRRDAGAVDLAA